MNIQRTNDATTPGNFLALSINRELEAGRSVLWFVTGGSSIDVASVAAKHIPLPLQKNLTVLLTDERYGEVSHGDSNWQQLVIRGFNLPEAKLIPILTGDESDVTTEKFNTVLSWELAKDSYKIALFGVGADGHIAGILPESESVRAPDWAVLYNTPSFKRITITIPVIEKLDEAVVYMQGEAKWEIFQELQKEKDIWHEPAQILKKIPQVTIFTDYPIEDVELAAEKIAELES